MQYFGRYKKVENYDLHKNKDDFRIFYTKLLFYILYVYLWNLYFGRYKMKKCKKHQDLYRN